MSIEDEINHRCTEGRLALFKPVMPDTPMERTLLISRNIASQLEGPWDGPKMEERWGRARADFETFVGGQTLSVSWEPFRARAAYFGRLDPVGDEVWDIRSRDPKPGLRVLGSFARTDTFVALEWDWRETLGGPGSKEWRDAIERSKAEWRKLFSPYEPHSGDNLHAYISDRAFLI